MDSPRRLPRAALAAPVLALLLDCVFPIGVPHFLDPPGTYIVWGALAGSLAIEAAFAGEIADRVLAAEPWATEPRRLVYCLVVAAAATALSAVTWPTVIRLWLSGADADVPRPSIGGPASQFAVGIHLVGLAGSAGIMFMTSQIAARRRKREAAPQT
ncbi:MAG: hypothetical protein V4510_08985 [bacterium]